MRRGVMSGWRGLLMLIAVLGYASMSAEAADPTDMPPASPSAPPASQGSSPQEEGKGGHRRAAMHRLKESCGEDVKKFCPHVEPGGGRIVQCLEQHQKDVSQACSQLLNRAESQQGTAH